MLKHNIQVLTYSTDSIFVVDYILTVDHRDDKARGYLLAIWVVYAWHLLKDEMHTNIVILIPS